MWRRGSTRRRGWCRGLGRGGRVCLLFRKVRWWEERRTRRRGTGEGAGVVRGGVDAVHWGGWGGGRGGEGREGGDGGEEESSGEACRTRRKSSVPRYLDAV